MKVEARTIVSALLPVGVMVGLMIRGALPYGPSPMPEISVRGHSEPEGCLRCHGDVRGLGPAHDASAFGCSPCHLGDPLALDEASAHAGMIVLAGDLPIARSTCGQSGCHTDEHRRVDASVMAGAPGILAVDRFVFGERPSPEGATEDDLRTLEPDEAPGSPAESHTRKLCASCHLGMPKAGVGDQGFFARGGGCTACHLGAPSAGAGTQGRLHPDVNAQVAERRCEGCHARSGRISLSYRGKLEVEPGDPRRTGDLPDGRPFTAVEPDVHAKAEMTCVDCHTERGVMGDGTAHVHSHQAVDVACDDCHAAAREVMVPSDRARVADVLRAAWTRAGRGGLSTAPRTTKSGTPLWRTDAVAGTMALHETGQQRKIPPTSDAAYHRLRGHARLSCQACHSAWAPRCAKCHTVFRPDGAQTDHLSGKATPGEWVETAGGNGGGAPLLAVGPRGTIGPFVEGMILRIDGIERVVDGAFWAPLDPHTTGKSRTCGSCHGTGASASYPAEGATTRPGARLLDGSERGRVLRVGPCLDCHPDYGDPIYADFPASLSRPPVACRRRQE